MCCVFDVLICLMCWCVDVLMCWCGNVWSWWCGDGGGGVWRSWWEMWVTCMVWVRRVGVGMCRVGDVDEGGALECLEWVWQVQTCYPNLSSTCHGVLQLFYTKSPVISQDYFATTTRTITHTHTHTVISPLVPVSSMLHLLCWLNITNDENFRATKSVGTVL